MDEEEAQAAADKLMDGRFNLDDFLKQLRQVKKIGPISQLLEMVPGFNQVAKQISSDDAERQMARTEAIISSMTIKERQNPRVLNGNRKRRIATGSGTSVQEINQLLTQFRQMQKMMKQLRDPRKLKGLMDMFGGGMR
jgi:signal recognition particle subunit SRP54